MPFFGVHYLGSAMVWRSCRFRGGAGDLSCRDEQSVLLALPTLDPMMFLPPAAPPMSSVQVGLTATRQQSSGAAGMQLCCEQFFLGSPVERKVDLPCEVSRC